MASLTPLLGRQEGQKDAPRRACVEAALAKAGPVLDRLWAVEFCRGSSDIGGCRILGEPGQAAVVTLSLHKITKGAVAPFAETRTR